MSAPADQTPKPDEPVVDKPADTTPGGADKPVGDKPADTTPEKTEKEKEEEEQAKQDAKIAKQLCNIVERSLEQLKPILELMTDHLNKASEKPKDEVDEEKLVDTVKPLIEQATGILKDTYGQIKGADPTGKLQNRAKQNAHEGRNATPEEQRLAEGLSKLTGDVTKTIENAKEKLKGMPHAQNKLGPLLAMLQDPLFQILSAVGLLLNGVLTLVGNLLNGLGLGGIVGGLLKGLQLDKLLGGLGLGGLTKSLGGKK